MAYVLILVVLLCLVGVAARAVLAGRRATGDLGEASGRQQVTDTSVTPPAHPREPLPGSATRREAQGKP